MAGVKIEHRRKFKMDIYIYIYILYILAEVKIEHRREFKMDEHSEPSKFRRIALLLTMSFAYQRNPRA